MTGTRPAGVSQVWSQYAHAPGNRALAELAAARQVLLLQGPVGPFFRSLAQELTLAEKSVHRVHFNAGDLRFGNRRLGEVFSGTLLQWKSRCQALLKTFRPDVIVLFGQDRPYHAIALRIARKKGIRCLIFEEGYLRPYHVTFECDGVNARSTLQLAAPAKALPTVDPLRFRVPFSRMAWLAMQYTFLAALGRAHFRHYRHHRSLKVLSETGHWLRAGWRKLVTKRSDRRALLQLRQQCGNNYFFFPLQLYCDAQISNHSPFEDVRDSIEFVIRSFAQHAPDGTALLIKQHPLDIGHRDYHALIRALVARFKPRGPIVYIREAHLPSVLSCARGTVTVNSTVGLSSLYHQTPVKVLGQAIYDQPGLTSELTLDAFWSAPGQTDKDQVALFRAQLNLTAQLPGSFYAGDKARAYEGLMYSIRQALQHADKIHAELTGAPDSA